MWNAYINGYLRVFYHIYFTFQYLSWNGIVNRMRTLFLLLMINFSLLIYAEMPTFNYSPYLDKIEASLEKQNYSDVQQSVAQLLDQINAIQQQILTTFFPEVYESYVLSSSVVLEEEDAYLDVGSVFNKTYENDAGNLLTVTLIHNDPAILQYTGLVNNPKLISGLESMSVITVQKSFAAIKKVSDDSPLIELNIVLSEDILLNIVGAGLTEEEMEAFVTHIDLAGIFSYLKS